MAEKGHKGRGIYIITVIIILAWIIAQVSASLTNEITTETAVKYTTKNVVSSTGIVLREEILLTPSELGENDYVYYLADELFISGNCARGENDNVAR